jgi:8-oxo-dGTP pyrophosphatase MutT (NUDIX family)
MNLSEECDGWPPERTVFTVSRIELRVLPGEHPFQAAQRAAILENWQGETAANPALFDGRMVFQRRLSVSENAIVGEGYLAPFSTFMWWRKLGGREGGFHLFAYPVLVSADGALVAIRMAAHTANPGQVYFAAGSIEEPDIVDGHCDIDGNMRREVLEETGLDLREAVSEPQFHAAHFRRVVSIFRLFRFALTAGEMVERIERHLAVAEDREIEGAVVIRSADPSAYTYNVAMLPILAWFFDGKA